MGVWNPYPSGHENDGDGIITAPPPLPPSLLPPPSRHTHTKAHTCILFSKIQYPQNWHAVLKHVALENIYAKIS